jgi:hypothetical protein
VSRHNQRALNAICILHIGAELILTGSTGLNAANILTKIILIKFPLTLKEVFI